VPWGTDYTPHDALARLTVHDARHAGGRFTVAASFMKIRDQRLTWPDHTLYAPPGWTTRARASTTTLGLHDIDKGVYDSAEFVIGLCVPNCAKAVSRDPAGSTVWLYGLPASARELSVAAATFPGDGSPPVVWQAGPRDLWSEVETAHRWWSDVGEPEVFDFGLTVTVTPNGRVHHTPWHESPDRPVPIADGVRTT